MTLKKFLLAGTALGTAAVLAAPAFAASDTQAQLDALRAQMEALQRKIDDVEIQHGDAIKGLEERKNDVEVSLKDGRPVFKSADGNFSFGLTGRAHLDVGGYSQDSASKANFGGLRGNANFRRLRMGATGTFARDFAYNIEFNFGDSGTESDARIYEAVLHYKGIDGLTLIAGATKPKMTLDDSTSSNDITFIERASASHSFNLPSDTVRLRDRPELRVDPQRYIDTGSIGSSDTATIYGPELAFNYGPVRAQGEYYRYDIEGIGGGSAKFDAWYLQASWIITGESYKYNIKKAAYSGVKPDNPFGFGGGGAGAWEIAARDSSANLNDTSAGIAGGGQDIITLGLNWYANNNLRFMLNYLNVDVEDRGGVANPNFGHDAVALRTQFAF